MSRDDEFIGRLEDYLEWSDGATPLPDRVRSAVHSELPRTRQVRPGPGLGRLLEPMGRARAALRLGLAAALVLAAALPSVLVIGGRTSSGIGGFTAAPTPTPFPTPILIRSAGLRITATEPGDYLLGGPLAVPITVSLPAGWDAKIGGPYAAFLGNGSRDVVSITTSAVFYKEQCTGGRVLDEGIRPSIAKLATALASLPDFTATAPSDVTLDGYAGKRISLTAPSDFSRCAVSTHGYQLFILPLGAVVAFTPGERMDLWIIDVQGQRVVVTLEAYRGQTAAELEQAQAIVESLRFGTQP